MHLLGFLGSWLPGEGGDAHKGAAVLCFALLCFPCLCFPDFPPFLLSFLCPFKVLLCTKASRCRSGPGRAPEQGGRMGRRQHWEGRKGLWFSRAGLWLKGLLLFQRARFYSVIVITNEASEGNHWCDKYGNANRGKNTGSRETSLHHL